MPLDTNDLREITAIIEKAVGRLEADIDDLMPRSEYENRHTELSARTKENADAIKDVVKWAMSEHEKINERINSRFDALDVSIQSIRKEISEGRITTIRYMVTTIVGFILGVAIPVLLYYILR